MKKAGNFMSRRLKEFYGSLGPSFLFAFITLGIIFSGCGTMDRYSYHAIQAEYADALLINDTVWDGLSEKSLDENKGLISPIFPEAPMKIQEVLFITLENNPDIKQAQSRIYQAKAMTDLSMAAFWPSIGFYTEYMQGDAPSSYLFKTIDQRKLPPDVNFNDPGWFESYESGLSARMNLFNSGKDYLAVQMAKEGEMIAGLNRQTLENLLVAQVIRTFYDTLAAEDFIEIARGSVNTVSEQLRIMKIRYERGGALKSDVLSMEVRLAQSQEQLLSSKNRFKVSLLALANLMGLDPAFFDEKQNVLEKSFFDIFPIPDTFDEGIVHAMEYRPEAAMARRQLVWSRMQLDSARAGYLPRLDLMAKYYVADPDMKYNLDRENWIAAIMFNWDLFTGFATSSAIKKADAGVKEMLAADQKEIQEIRLDVKTAYLNHQEAQSRVQVAVSAVDSAAESFEIVKKHYEGGSVPITRFLEAELDLRRARINATSAFYNRKKAKAEIARAIGLWSSQSILLKNEYHED
jgi:outer membrane protein TolC